MRLFFFLILFSAIHGMQEQSALLSLQSEILTDIVEYAISNKNFFIKRRTLHDIAESCKLLQRVSVKIINKKENKSTIKYIVKAHDWVEESLLLSTSKKCPYGIKKIKTVEEHEEVIGYLVEDKITRLKSLSIIKAKLKKKGYRSSFAKDFQTFNNVINKVNQQKIILESKGSVLILDDRIKSIKQKIPPYNIIKLANFLSGVSTVSLLYFIYHIALYHGEENFDKKILGLSFLLSPVGTGISTIISVTTLYREQCLSLHNKFRENLISVASHIKKNEQYIFPPISLSRVEKFLHFLEKDIFKINIMDNNQSQ